MCDIRLAHVLVLCLIGAIGFAAEGLSDTVANKNATMVTLPISEAIPTNLVSLDLGNVAVGEVIIIEGFARLGRVRGLAKWIHPVPKFRARG